MKMKRIVSLVSILLVFLVLTVPVLAQEPGGDRVVVGSNVTLEDGETVEGSVTVLGGNFDMEEGSEVEGDVVVFGGNVTIDGKVEGDVVALGGNVRINAPAEVQGGVSALGGNLTVNPEAEVDGPITEGLDVQPEQDGFVAPAPAAPDSPERPSGDEYESRRDFDHEGDWDEPRRDFDHGGDWDEPRSGFFRGVFAFFSDGISDIFAAVIVAALAALIMLFFPVQANLVEETLLQNSALSFVVGLVTVPAMLAVVFVLALFFWLIIPICGILVVVIAFTGAMLFGWSVAGKIFGDQLFDRLGSFTPTNLSATLLGVGVITILNRMPFVDHLPLIGWMFGLLGGLIFVLVGFTGLGAVILSRFGTREFQRTASGTTGPTPPPLATTGEATETTSPEPTVTRDADAPTVTSVSDTPAEPVDPDTPAEPDTPDEPRPPQA